MFSRAGNYPGPVRDKTQTNSAAPGDRLIRAGAVVFFLGAVATLVTVAPLFLGAKPFPTYMFGLSMLMAVGFLVAGAGVLRSVAAGRRQARGAAPGASR
ncbi:membrane protein [Streptomyces sp. NRRL WC-3723]|nr:membrane protein [Streptomyces sp. NRRL WC-3723]